MRSSRDNAQVCPPLKAVQTDAAIALPLQRCLTKLRRQGAVPPAIQPVNATSQAVGAVVIACNKGKPSPKPVSKGKDGPKRSSFIHYAAKATAEVAAVLVFLRVIACAIAFPSTCPPARKPSLPSPALSKAQKRSAAKKLSLPTPISKKRNGSAAWKRSLPAPTSPKPQQRSVAKKPSPLTLAPSQPQKRNFFARIFGKGKVRQLHIAITHCLHPATIPSPDNWLLTHSLATAGQGFDRYELSLLHALPQHSPRPGATTQEPWGQ